MAKKHRKQVAQHTDELATALGIGDSETEPETEPEQTEAETDELAPEGGETVQPVADAEPEEVIDLEAVLRKLAETLPEALREKARVELTKLYAQELATKIAKGWVSFDGEFKPAVEKLITELVAKHGLKPENQRITITFPGGKASYARGLKGKDKNGDGNSNRNGFPSQWGKAMAGDREFTSPSKMAEVLGCQVNGKGAGYSDMVDVFDSQGHPVLELPAGSKLNELLSKQTDPARRAKLEKLSGKVFRVKA